MVELTSPPPLYKSAYPASPAKTARATTTSTSTSAAEAQAAAVDDKKAVLSSDFETFLKMLTVQVQNQDPLNPVDSTEYATQLATFSSVEQQVLTNDLLRSLSDTLGGNALNEASRWIGMEGLVRAPVYFSGQPISIRPDYPEDADRAELVVRDASGTEVARYALDVDEENIVWGGYDETDTMMDAGIYRFSIESYEGDTLLSSSTAQVYSRIEEVRNDDGSILIQMSDGTEMSPDQINGLRWPSA